MVNTNRIVTEGKGEEEGRTTTSVTVPSFSTLLSFIQTPIKIKPQEAVFIWLCRYVKYVYHHYVNGFDTCIFIKSYEVRWRAGFLT